MTHCLKILVVDDDKDNAQSLGELFELEGHTVTVAHSGEAAIEAYMKNDFDIAFMDVMMPGKNGVESFMAIREMRPDARVYMMTGYSVEQLLQQAMDHGAMGVLDKPIEMGKLMRAVEQAKPGGIVVVAEDDPRFGGELKRMMTHAGMRCELVHGDADVVGHESEVVIIDTGRPLIQSMEIYTRMKRGGRVRPAIIITRPSDGGDDAFQALRDVAVTGILNKPFDPAMLLGRLNILAA